MPIFNKFAGIRPLVEGMVDADYLNCIPTGESVVERSNFSKVLNNDLPTNYVGRIAPPQSYFYNNDTEHVFWDAKSHWERYFNTMIQFIKAIRVGNKIVRFFMLNNTGMRWVDKNNEDYGEVLDTPRYNQHLFIVVTKLREDGYVDSSSNWLYSTPVINYAETNVSPDEINCTICGTTPHILFTSLKSSGLTFWMNIDEHNTITETYTKCPSGHVLHINVGCMLPSVLPTPTNGAPEIDITQLDNLAAFYAFDTYYPYSFYWQGSVLKRYYTPAPVTGSEWYDNKFVCVCNNVVWLTCTDPSKYLLKSIDQSTATGFDWIQYGTNDYWTNAYKSTLSTDSTFDVKSAYGLLYFINKNSIELWTRSGDESDSLNPVSNYVSEKTIKECCIVDGRLVAIEFGNNLINVGLIDSSGNVSTISNSSINKILMDNSWITGEECHWHITSIVENRTNQIALWRDISDNKVEYIVYNTACGAWYRLIHTKETAPILGIGDWSCILRNGYKGDVKYDYIIGKIDDISGAKYERRIVDNYQQFTQRRCFSNIEVYGSFAGKASESVENNDKLMMQISTTQGATWSRDFERTPPRLGQYVPKIVFNGLGSGDSIIFKFKWFNIKPYVINGINLNVR